MCGRRLRLFMWKRLVNIMDPEVQFKKYAKYWQIQELQETLPEVEVGKVFTRNDLLTVVKDMQNSQQQIFKRSYQPLELQENNGEGSPQDKLGFTCKILQWNCLAQGLCMGNDNFVLCPNAVLAWDQRKLLILEELLSSEADILCLQEVDKFWFLKNTLNCIQYEGIFFPKPESPALYTKDSSGPDGCALFYNKSKLKMLKYDLVNLRTLDDDFTNQVCVIGVFCPVDDTESPFCVAAVHLKAKAGWHQLRHSQGAFLLKYIEEHFSNLPVIICGDFNADSSEPVYDAFKLSSLDLQSMYSLLSENGEEPPYTTWKVRGGPNGNIETCKTIDYMWSSKDRVTVKSLFSIPEPKDVDQNRLPSCRYPSDHFSLAAEVSISK